MPEIFLSYSGKQKPWIMQLRESGLLEEELSADIFDYKIDPIAVGLLDTQLELEIEASNIFIAFIDEEYKNGKGLQEFNFAYKQFFRRGLPVQNKIFAVILLDSKGRDWFETTRHDTRRAFPNTFAYHVMYDAEGPKPLYVGKIPQTYAWDSVRKFLKQIKASASSVPEKALIVLIGRYADQHPKEMIDTIQDFKLAMGELPRQRPDIREIEDDWANREPAPEASLWAQRNAKFVFPVYGEWVWSLPRDPHQLLDLMKDHELISEDDWAKIKTDPTRVVYWKPPFMRGPAFPTGTVSGTTFINGSLDDLVAYLSFTPVNSATSMGFESQRSNPRIAIAAAERLRDTLTNALTNVINPPEPELKEYTSVDSIIEALSKKKVGIFITYDINTEVADEISPELKSRLLLYKELFDRYKGPGNLYRIALVRGPNWSVYRDLSRPLRDWHFIGLKIEGDQNWDFADGIGLQNFANDVTDLVARAMIALPEVQV